MDDVLAGEVVGAGDFGGARAAAVQGFAFADQLGTGGAVDGAVDAAAAEEGFVWNKGVLALSLGGVC